MVDTEGSSPSKLQKAASAVGSVFRAVGKWVEGYFAWIERKNQENIEAADRRRIANIERMKRIKGDIEEEIALEEDLATLKEKKNAIARKKRKEETDHQRMMQEIEGSSRHQDDEDYTGIWGGGTEQKQRPRRRQSKY